MSEVYALRPEARDYFSFAFIRHPFGRALSLYSEIFSFPRSFRRVQRSNKDEKRRLFFHWYGLEDITSFDAYCRWLNTPWGSDSFANRHYLSQHMQIRLPDGRLPDFVGRLETVEEDLKRIAGRLGMPVPKLPMLNTMAGWTAASPDALERARAEMASGLTEENKALLRTRYAKDLELYRQTEERR